MRTVTDRAPGSVLAGRFRLERFLGAGAYGAVWQATDTQGRACAIKLLHDGPQRSREASLRFVREGRLPTALASPHIVQVYEVGVDPTSGGPFIVMELLQGEDLEQLSARVGPLPPEIAARFVAQACEGLAVAHQAGIVHRDIKPSNLFLHDTPGGDPVLKVTDFGIAKALFGDEALTASGSLMGTPLYAAPEQLEDAKRVDARADVWSLGMTLYALLAGRPAFAHLNTLQELIIALRRDGVPPLQHFAPWVTPALARVVHGTLLRELPSRCPSVQQLRRALLPFCGTSEVVRRADLVPVSSAERTQVAEAAAPVELWADAEGASVGSHFDRLVGKSIGGEYTLKRVIGAGGMGAVFEAEGAGGRYAVKVLQGDPANVRPELLRRFVREARNTKAIDHGNVVRVIDADTDAASGFPYIVMELLEGTDLDQLIKRCGALEPSATARVFADAARGIAAAHARGIVHRDIKPANLFLTRTTSGYVVRVCDFGIAKQTGEAAQTLELTHTGGVLGSPMYMSPEQAKSAKHIDFRTDVWSLGVALFEALSGRKPWEGSTSVGELILAICTQDPPNLRALAPWVDLRLVDVVRRAMQRDPLQRFSSMEEFALALEPVAAHSLTAIPSPAALDRTEISAGPPAFGSTTAAAAAETLIFRPATKRRARLPIVLGGAAAGLLLVAVGATLLRTSAPSEPADQASAPTPSTPASPPRPKLRVLIDVRPENATVTVDGSPVSVRDGKVALVGQPGDARVVEVRLGDLVEKRTVLIGKDGNASVSLIELPAATPTASTTAPPAPPPKPLAKPPTIASAITPAAPLETTKPITTKPKPKPKDEPLD